MAKQNIQDVGIMEGGGSFELEVGENGKSKYITLPLSYNFEFQPEGGEGEQVTVSSVVSKGTQTIIKTTGSTAHWKLRITDTPLKKQSGHDGAGNTTPPDDGENDDRPGAKGNTVDWFWEAMEHEDETTRSVVLNAKKTIIIQEECI